MAPLGHHFTQIRILNGICLLMAKNKKPLKHAVYKGCGGKIGIRTLVRVLA